MVRRQLIPGGSFPRSAFNPFNRRPELGRGSELPRYAGGHYSRTTFRTCCWLLCRRRSRYRPWGQRAASGSGKVLVPSVGASSWVHTVRPRASVTRRVAGPPAGAVRTRRLSTSPVRRGVGKASSARPVAAGTRTARMGEKDSAPSASTLPSPGPTSPT